ncbi:MAG TPA: hypothetical protein VF937_14300 [Chloroflexota bacterium]
MTGRTHRVKLLTGLAAACLALTSITPSFAQSAPALGSWLAGPDAKGSSTIVGRVEAPRARQGVNSASNLLVSGWAADVTAAGWAGIDGVEVWSGAQDKGGTKLASGMVGLARADIGDAIGGSFTNSGFSAVVPGSTWASMKAGAQTLYVYLHTPGKGTWYRTVSINLTVSATLAFPNDPIVVIAKPQDGTSVTQKQKNSKFTFSGIALDRNLTTDPNALSGPGCSGCGGATGAIGTQARGAGISSITAYIDTPPAKGDTSTFGSFGAPCAGCLYGNILVSNAGSLNTPGKPQGSLISREFGSQFDFSGWALSINPALLSPGWHTLVVTATSSVTGKQSTASSTFQILDLTHTKIQP